MPDEHEHVPADAHAAGVPPTDPTAAAVDLPPVEPAPIHDPLAAVVPPHDAAVKVEDPLAPHDVVTGGDPDQAALDAGEEAAEAAIGNVLDDVGVDVHVPGPVDGDPHHGTTDEDDQMAMAAAAAAAAVQAADGMAVVVDQALLATAAAAAASQVADVLAAPSPPDAAPPPLAPPLPDPAAVPIHDSRLPSAKLPPGEEHGDLLQARREKDRRRYSAMSPDQRAAYNAHRRELYHKQGEAARKRRRERERERYHSLEGDNKKSRNERRAKLERDRYNKLSKEELAARNARRRERAKQRKLQQGKGAAAPAPVPMGGVTIGEAMGGVPVEESVPVKAEPTAEGVPELPAMAHPQDPDDQPPLPEAMVDAHLADASAALAAEVAEQVIAGTELEGAMAAAASSAAGTAHGGGEETVEI